MRYRVMAFTTATLLIVIVFVGLPLQLLAHRPEVVNVVGTIHGFLYLVYLLAAFQLTRKLHVPKWQMALILLAGTVPFCAFVAERKLTRRFDAQLPARPAAAAAATSADPAAAGTAAGLASAGTGEPALPSKRRRRAAEFRRRWLSRRALLLHLEVAVLAPGCAVAGWWQATRALAGNGLSWFYSIEWPIFCILSIAGWWFLVHEDPEAYRARRWRRSHGDEVPGGAGSDGTAQGLDPSGQPSGSPGERPAVTVADRVARHATVLAALVGAEIVVGIVALVLIPPGRPSGWVPARWAAVYAVHAVIGFPLAVGAVLLIARAGGSRIARLSGWVGAVGVTMAGAGGLLTVSHPLRIAGIVLMMLGAVIAGFGYLFPTFEKLGQ